METFTVLVQQVIRVSFDPVAAAAGPRLDGEAIAQRVALARATGDDAAIVDELFALGTVAIEAGEPQAEICGDA